MSDLPPSTHRCLDCGVGWGPCVCTPEYAAWERAEEERIDEEFDWLTYVESLAPAGTEGTT